MIAFWIFRIKYYLTLLVSASCRSKSHRACRWAGTLWLTGLRCDEPHSLMALLPCPVEGSAPPHSVGRISRKMAKRTGLRKTLASVWQV